MPTNYEKLIDRNIARLFSQAPPDLDIRLGAERKEDSYFFRAFGKPCCLSASGITLSDTPVKGPRGLIISLYALHAVPDPVVLEPFKSFKDFPGSMPYQGAFSANSERVLIPHVRRIEEKQTEIKTAFDGADGKNGDFSFLLHPLPRIVLCYIFYRDDEEFPASATCLFSSNALSFIPLDGLADVGEYTSKEIIRMVQ